MFVKIFLSSYKNNIIKQHIKICCVCSSMTEIVFYISGPLLILLSIDFAIVFN